MDDVPGATITRYCSSSVQTTRMAFHAIKAGEGDVFVSAGVETVSRFAKGTSDYLARHPQPGLRRRRGAHRGARRARRRQAWHDPREDGVLPDAYIAMGQTAENVATLRGPDPRRSSTSSACGRRTSPRRRSPTASGQREITPVTTPDGTVVSARRRPARRASPTRRSPSSSRSSAPTAWSPPATAARSTTAPPRSSSCPTPRPPSSASPRWPGSSPPASARLSPEIMGLGPVEATKQALAHAGMTIGDIDLVEINEAFAAQVVPSYQDLGIDLDRLNVNGGAIAVGHPFGMTGARLQNTMLNSLDWHDKSTGLITMCVGGGQGMALILERLG